MENTENEKPDVENQKLTDDELCKPLNISLKQKLFLAAMVKHNFDITKACKEIEITRRCYQYWIANDTDFTAAFDETFEERKDLWEAEGNFAIEGQYTINKDENGVPNELDQNGRPIRHYINLPDRGFLKFKHLTKMKDRGYVYRQELTGPEGRDLFDGFEIDLTKPAR